MARVCRTSTGSSNGQNGRKIADFLFGTVYIRVFRSNSIFVMCIFELYSSRSFFGSASLFLSPPYRQFIPNSSASNRSVALVILSLSLYLSLFFSLRFFLFEEASVPSHAVPAIVTYAKSQAEESVEIGQSCRNVFILLRERASVLFAVGEHLKLVHC